MSSCTPAADVYGGQPDPLHACLPMTGAPLLTPILLALLLLSLGLMLRGGLMVLYARQHAEEARRADLHPNNPLLRKPCPECRMVHHHALPATCDEWRQVRDA